MSLLDNFTLKPKRLGLVVIVLGLLAVAFNTIRNSRIDALARAGVDKKPDPEVVKKLASYSGQRSAELLLIIAGSAPTEENRLTALQALVDRKDALRISRLSELLVLPESLKIRQAMANALYKTGCTPECVKNVMYHEERMWRGDRPSEDVQANQPKELSEVEKELQTSLDEVIKKNKPALGAVLARVYGLASDFPSPFAVETVERLELKEACPLLMHTFLSVNDQVRASPEYKYLSEAVGKLGCENQPRGRR